MRSVRQVLNECTVEELRECARSCRLPATGHKENLISVLRGHPVDAILESLGAETLRDLCRSNGLPVSGEKGELVDRLFEIVEDYKPNAATRKKCYLCGRMFDLIVMHRHHFIPKSVVDGDSEGGTVYLNSDCHTIFHNREAQEEARKGRKLAEDEIISLHRKVGKEIRAGMYGPK